MNKKKLKYFGIALLIIGILFLVIAYFSNSAYQEKILTYDKVVGQIIDIKEVRGDMRPLIVYEVDNKEYKYLSEYYSSNLKVGDKMGLLVNPEDPTKTDNGKNSLTMIFSCFGFLFSILGFVLTILKKKKFNNIEKEIDV